MKTINNRSVNAIFCDDLRYETGGKVTVVGMYTPGTTIKFPEQGSLTLPKFCVIASFRTPADRPLNDLSLEVRLDDAVLHTVEIPESSLKPEPKPADASGLELQLMLEFGNLSIPRPGTIKLIAIADSDELYVCPGLSVHPQPSPPPDSTPI